MSKAQAAGVPAEPMSEEDEAPAGPAKGAGSDFAEGREATEAVDLRNAGDALRAVAFVLDLSGTACVGGQNCGGVRLRHLSDAAKSVIVMICCAVGRTSCTAVWI